MMLLMRSTGCCILVLLMQTLHQHMCLLRLLLLMQRLPATGVYVCVHELDAEQVHYSWRSATAEHWTRWDA